MERRIGALWGRYILIVGELDFTQEVDRRD